MTDLLYDFENRSNELELMQEEVSDLKTRFNELEAKIARRSVLADDEPVTVNMNSSLSPPASAKILEHITTFSVDLPK
jgi:predicted  nucleic acid-binding Zn-ribbon protein